MGVLGKRSRARAAGQRTEVGHIEPRSYKSVRICVAWAKIAMSFLALSGICACVTYTDDGQLVRHQFGYTRTISPLTHSDNQQIRVLEVTNFGFWVKSDRRAGPVNEGAGIGLGAKYTRREEVPLECSLVIRIHPNENFSEAVTLINDILEGMDPCIIQDSNLPLL